jgi:hypothetical protein
MFLSSPDTRRGRQAVAWGAIAFSATTLLSACGAADAMSGKTVATQKAVSQQTEASVRQALQDPRTAGSAVETLRMVNGERTRYNGKVIIDVVKFGDKVPAGATKVSASVYKLKEALLTSTITCQADATAITYVELGSETKVDKVEFTDPNAPVCTSEKYDASEDVDPDQP